MTRLAAAAMFLLAVAVARHQVIISTGPPIVASLSPSTGAAGTLVTITGQHFGPAPQDFGTTITFNGTPAVWPTASWSDTSVTVVVPAGATSGPVVLTRGGLASQPLPFTVTTSLVCNGTTVICVTQTGAGTQDGTAGNPHPVSWMAIGGNWGAGGSAIDPGDTVLLQGTFSASAGTSRMVPILGSGSSGNPITLLFDAGATATAPYWGTGGFIGANTAVSFITIDGGGTGSVFGNTFTPNGDIVATANGALLANHVAGSNCVAFTASNAHDITVQNLECENMFVAVQANANNEVTGVNCGNSAMVCLLNPSSNVLIQNNVAHDLFDPIYITYGTPGRSNIVVTGNQFSNMETNIIGSSTTNATLDTVTFSNNDCSNMALWDLGGSNHHEFLHLWAVHTGSTITNATVSGNYLHGTLGGFATAEWFLECTPGTCTVTAYNNVVTMDDTGSDIFTGAGGNGLTECKGGTCFYYNNTFYSTVGQGSVQNVAMHSENGGVVTEQNNICLSMWTCGQTGDSDDCFGLAVACTGTNLQTGSPVLDLSFRPQSGSAAIAHAANLTGKGITALDSDRLGTARPGSGAWDIGAYQFVVATTHYVRQGGVGAAPCADWTNACNALPALTSGHTYYLAGGTYAAFSVSVTNVTMLKATSAAHGTAVGWSGTYATTLAHISAAGSSASVNVTVNSSASGFVLNGQVGSLSATDTDYGFEIDAPSNCAIAHHPFLVGAVSSVTVEHVALLTCAADIEREAFFGAGSASNVTISNNLFNDYQGAIDTESSTLSTVLFERNYLENHRGSGTHHAEWVDINAGVISNFTIRYNIFHDSSSTACINLANNTNNTGPTYIYGNVFGNDTSGNGIVSVSSGHTAGNIVFYNNTIYDKTGSGSVLRDGGASGNISRNNLYYNCATCSIAADIDNDYGAYFGTNSGIATETHRQNGGPSDPFVNDAGGNWRLLAHTTTGATLASPYDVDPDGNPRGVGGGIWDRGVYQLTSGAPLPRPH